MSTKSEQKIIQQMIDLKDALVGNEWAFTKNESRINRILGTPHGRQRVRDLIVALSNIVR